jgi:hypothetical protein
MKTLSFLLLLLTLVSCGKSSTKSSSTSTSTTIIGQVGELIIPARGMIGGGARINISGRDYQIDTLNLDSMSLQYLNQMWDRQAVAETKYRVGYSGRIGQSPCTFNPGAICTNAILTSLMGF